MKMSSEERVLAAFRGEDFDRVPVTEFFWEEFTAKWRNHYRLGEEADIYDFYELDARTVGAVCAPFVGREEVLSEDNRSLIMKDNWGSVLKVLKKEATPEYISFAIPDEDSYDSFEFGDPGDPARFDGSGRAGFNPTSESYGAKVARFKGRYFLFMELFDPWESLWRMRGMENALMDMVRCPNKVKEMALRIGDHMVSVGKEMMERGDVPGVWIWGDIAYNNGPVFSPKHYRELIKPGLKRICSAFKDKLIAYHTDGDPRKLIPDLIDAGISVLDPLEAKANMDVAQLKKEYGDKIGFIGNVDNTRLLTRGSREEIEKVVKEKLEVAKEGGYMIGSSHSIGPDVPLENYEIFRKTVAEYGKVR